MNETLSRLLDAAVKDDVKAFDEVYDRKTRNVCYGRFPLLDVLYLYGSRKLLSVHREELIKETRYEIAEEPWWLYRRFASCAGKALRYWAGTDKIVTPVEMMAVVGSPDLKSAWVDASKEDKKRLTAIYQHAFDLEPYEKKGKLYLPKPRMRTSRRLTIGAVAALLVIALLLSLAGTTLSAMSMGGWDYRIAIAAENDLQKVLSKEGKYKLTEDMALPSGDVVKCDIDAGGHTLSLTLGDAPLWSRFEGKLSHAVIELEGDVAVKGDWAALIGDNYGEWTDVTLRLKGNLNLTVDPAAQKDEEGALRTSLLAVRNYGVLKDLVAEGYYTQTFFGINWETSVSLTGTAGVDSRFGTFACDNFGRIDNALLGLYVLSQNVDMGGVAYRNEGVIEGCTVASVSELTQTSSLYQWSPLVGGIAGQNEGEIKGCTVEGTVQGYKQNIDVPENAGEGNYIVSQASVGGIVSTNEGSIDHCAFAGKVIGGGDRLTVGNVGGIAANNGSDEDSSASITRCNVVGQVQAVGFVIYLGGVVGSDYGAIERTVYLGRLSYNYNQDNRSSCGMGVLAGVTALTETSRYTGNKCLLQQIALGTEVTTLPVVGLDRASEAEDKQSSEVTGVTTYAYSQTLILEEEYWYGKGQE